MTDFHFIRPWWLLALIVLLFVLYLLKRITLAKSGWQQFLPEHLKAVLLENSRENSSQHNQQSKNNRLSGLLLPFIIGFITIIALAGPTWKKLPQPVYDIEQGSVLIMDMSYSMLATDLKPNRLTRARFKATDLLDKLTDGDIGLIAYAGDAFTISPLTADANNIKLLLPSLSPDIMPELGSNPLSALMLADTMLKNAGHIKGDIYWFTDGIDFEDIQDIKSWSATLPHHLHILGIGTQSGAPIKLTSGELLKDNSGAIVIPKLNPDYLSSVALNGRGTYETIRNDIKDINNLLASALTKKSLTEDEQEQTADFQVGDQWQEVGPYLLLIILPLILSYFRRGNLLVILPMGLPIGLSLSLFFSLLLTPAPSYAQEEQSMWQDLWQTKDQQAQAQFNQQNYQSAAKQFTDPNWQGSAHFKAQEYEQALQAFQKDNSATGLYNQGNALAQLQKLDEAIEAYEEALSKDPNLLDAKENKEKLEALQKQQQEQQQNNKDQDSQSKESQSEENQSEQNQSEEGKSDGQSKENDTEGEQSEDSQSDSAQEQNNQSGENQQQDPSQSQQNPEDNQDENQEKSQSQSDNETNEENEQNNPQEQAVQHSDEQQSDEEKSAQQVMSGEAEKLAQEVSEKHQQLLNKVTDDPYLLLRNKMQLEYQKRRQEGRRSGVNKQW